MPVHDEQEFTSFQDRIEIGVDEGVILSIRYYAPNQDGQIDRIMMTNAAWATSLGIRIGMDREEVVQVFGYDGRPPLVNQDSLPDGETVWFTNPTGTDDPGAMCSTHVTFDDRAKVMQIEMWPSPMSITREFDFETPGPPTLD